MKFFKYTNNRKRGFDLFQVGVAIVVGLVIWVGGMRLYSQVSNSAESREVASEMYMVGTEIRNYFRNEDSYTGIVNEHDLDQTDFGLASGIPNSILEKYETDGVGADYFTLDRPGLSEAVCERLMQFYYGNGTELRCSKSGTTYKFRVTYRDE